MHYGGTGRSRPSGDVVAYLPKNKERGARIEERGARIEVRGSRKTLIIKRFMNLIFAAGMNGSLRGHTDKPYFFYLTPVRCAH